MKSKWLLLLVGLAGCADTASPSQPTPVNVFIDEGSGPNPGLVLTHNAFFAEPLGNGSLRFYFLTESDNQADLLVYDATPWVNRPQP